MTFNTTIIPGTWSIDKFIHIAGCFVVTILIANFWGLLVGAAAGVLVGAAREVQKAITPGESMEYLSMACDAAGVLLGVLFAATQL